MITQSYHTASEDLKNSELAFVFHCRKQAMRVLNNVKVSKLRIFNIQGKKVKESQREKGGERAERGGKKCKTIDKFRSVIVYESVCIHTPVSVEGSIINNRGLRLWTKA